ncbi:MAG: site-specific integrase, partial [Alistipes sp.]|nr:site-specific integrase [Alistipes sp.]
MNNSLYFYSRDGITVSVILDSRRALANGNYPVKTRVTYHRTHVYYPTGKNLSQEDWQRLGTTRLR